MRGDDSGGDVVRVEGGIEGGGEGGSDTGSAFGDMRGGRKSGWRGFPVDCVVHALYFLSMCAKRIRKSSRCSCVGGGDGGGETKGIPPMFFATTRVHARSVSRGSLAFAPADGIIIGVSSVLGRRGCRLQPVLYRAPSHGIYFHYVLYLNCRCHGQLDHRGTRGTGTVPR